MSRKSRDAVVSHQKDAKDYVSADERHIRPATAVLSYDGGGASSHNQAATATAVDSEANRSSTGSSCGIYSAISLASGTCL